MFSLLYTWNVHFIVLFGILHASWILWCISYIIVSIAVKIHHDHGISCKGKYLIEWIRFSLVYYIIMVGHGTGEGLRVEKRLHLDLQTAETELRN